MMIMEMAEITIVSMVVNCKSHHLQNLKCHLENTLCGIMRIVIGDELRIITPIEAERIQGFKDNWTDIMPERMRYFCMGNALVVPMVTRMGKTLNKIFEKE